MELVFLIAVIAGILAYLHVCPTKVGRNALEAAYASGYEAGVRAGMIEVARAIHRAAMEDVPISDSTTKDGTPPPEKST